MSNKILKIGLSALLMFGLVACGNKSTLNIPETPPADALQQEMTPEGLIRMGQRLEDAGDWNTSGTLYADALELDNTLVEAHLGLGRVLSQIGENNLAAISYGNAFDLDHDNYPALKGYVQGLLANGGQSLVLVVIDQYLAGNPPSAELLNYKGLAHDLDGDFGAAEVALREGLLLTRQGQRLHSTLLGNLALSLGLAGKTSAAMMLLNPYVGDMRSGLERLSSFQSSIRQNLALVYALAGNPESAVEVAKSALSAEEAEFNRTFYVAIGKLSGDARVKAVFLGELPPDYIP